jgi:hypothetical protein
MFPRTLIAVAIIVVGLAVVMIGLWPTNTLATAGGTFAGTRVHFRVYRSEGGTYFSAVEDRFGGGWRTETRLVDTAGSSAGDATISIDESGNTVTVRYGDHRWQYRVGSGGLDEIDPPRPD